MERARILRRQLEKSFRTRGVLGTLRFAAQRLVSMMRSRPGGDGSGASDGFDRQFGVDTAGRIPLSNLDISQRSWIHGVEYQPIGSEVFRGVLRQSPAGPEGFTFVDMGSGKGRAILLAAEQPFDRVIGVEFSQELTEIARANLALYPATRIRAGRVELVCGDATEFAWPAAPVVLFLYNPFGDAIMRQVADGVSASLERHPRQFVVLYYDPQCPAAWDGVAGLSLRRALPDLRIYASPSVGAFEADK